MAINKLFENPDKIRAAIARAAHTIPKKVFLIEGYSDGDITFRVLAKVPVNMAWDTSIHINPHGTKFEVFPVGDGKKLEAVIDRS
jgi:hypothetical protein